MPTEKVQEFLEHVGVKGMRWGVRRSSSGKLTSTSKNKTSHPTKNLSNQELRTRIERMKLDAEYSTLAKSGTNSKSTGRAYAKSLLKDNGNRVVSTVVTAFATAAAAIAVKKVFKG